MNAATIGLFGILLAAHLALDDGRQATGTPAQSAARSADFTHAFRDLPQKISKLYGRDAPHDLVVELIRPDGTSTTIRAGTGGSEPSGSASGSTSGGAGWTTARKVASGVVISEEGGKIVIDTKPCESRLVAFTEPYTKTSLGKIECGSRQFERVQVGQK
jgi:hypothetical protein